MTIIGIIGAILLAGCGIPLMLDAIAYKHIEINTVFLLMWTLGEIFTLLYVWGDVILMLNYGINILCLIPVWWYKE